MFGDQDLIHFNGTWILAVVWKWKPLVIILNVNCRNEMLTWPT